MKRLSIGAIILTYNEELHIRRCIESACRVCKQVYVVDSYSTDQTCKIARSCGAVVLQNKYVNQAQQFQWALDNCPINADWTMRIDADEYLTDELIEEILNKLPDLPDDITGCFLPLRVVFMDKMLKYGLSHQVQILRLWRTGSVYMEQRWMDERCVLKSGKSINLKKSFVDHNLKGLGEFILKHNNYSNREAFIEVNRRYHLIDEGDAEELAVRNRQKSTYYILPKFLRAFMYFFVRYFVFLGFLDGLRGFIWLTLQAYWYRFLVDAKLYEMEKKIGKNPSRREVINYVQQYFKIDIDYGSE